MSETPHIATEEELAKLNAQDWNAQVVGKGAENELPTIEQIKTKVDIRNFPQKVVDGAAVLPALWDHDKGRLGLLMAEGGVEALATAGTIIADIGVSGVWNPLANIYNSTLGNALNATTDLMGGNNTWATLPTKDSFFDFTAAAQEAIEFTEPTELWITDENGVEVKNPFADAEWVTKGIGSGVVDIGSFVLTAGGSGALLGIAKNSRLLKPLTQGTKSLQYVKNVERVEDAIELLGKSKTKLAKAETNFGKAADILDKADEFKLKPGAKTPYETVGKDIADDTLKKVNKKIDKGQDLQQKAKGHREHADAIGEGKRTRSKLEDGYEKLNEKMGGATQTPITQTDMKQYVGEVVTTGSPKGLKSVTSKVPFNKTPAQRINKIDGKLKELGDEASDIVRKKELSQTRDQALKNADDELNKLGDRAETATRRDELIKAKDKAIDDCEKGFGELGDKVARREELLFQKGKALNALQKELDDGVNKLAERLGLDKFSAADAMKHADQVEYVSATGLKGIFESAHTGFYKGFRFADPTANPWMEIPGFTFAAGSEYYGGKAEAQAREKRAEDLGKKKSGYEETIKDNQILHKDIVSGEFNAESNGPIDFSKDPELNGKPIGSKKIDFNGVSSGNTILKTGDDQTPPENGAGTKNIEDCMRFSLPPAN